ncbi:VWA domain-containing protein [Leptolyngbya sp. CCNP1308]|uniref:VWA domain-containing protein n=1 Tax=Leptolyngbya sp. CCNP1308 TaxID=3110255 RepID=UPI002B202BFF|nr:VWA domain-containing protein [Leptolyngbya sp. CCNP1308]MEA5448796.1 VWA domain-containing protein [Leptolyngbya sp. CCNP1308]
MRRLPLILFLLSLCAVLLWNCTPGQTGRVAQVDSVESAQQALQQSVMPNINVGEDLIADEVASRYTTDQIEDPLPDVNTFPLYAAQPGGGNTAYIEIYSSSEKANVDRQNERWLVEVAEAFNQRQETLPSGEVIQVGVRQVASGTAARLLGAGAVQPQGYSPSNDLWVAMVQSQGVSTVPVAARLVPNTAGWVLPKPVYDSLAENGTVSFDRLLNAIASGEVTVAYPNPYSSSTALNLLYTLYWRAAGHQENGGQLTVAELQTPQVNSVFDQFQQQVLITTPTTLDLQELFLRDQSNLQAFPLEYQNYLALREVPGFSDTEFVPFGVPHNNPLVGFGWNTPQQAAALQRFAQFAQSAEMQTLAQQQGFVETDYLKANQVPPFPNGETLLAAQSNWKLRKDGGRTVYMALVIDTSGSMEGDRIQALKDGLRVAAGQINAGNYVSVVTFADAPTRRLPLAPFDQLQHQKFLATVDSLRADGATAMYDGAMVGLADLLAQKEKDPNGRYYLLLLSDGEVNRGYTFDAIQDILTYSDVRFYPIAYGEVNQGELQAIAALRESTVQQGTPDNVQTLFKDLFQVNL